VESSAFAQFSVDMTLMRIDPLPFATAVAGMEYRGFPSFFRLFPQSDRPTVANLHRSDDSSSIEQLIKSEIGTGRC
jgi:hypothetical protein